MARARRRSNKSNTQDSPEPTTGEETTATPPESQSNTESQPAPQDEDKCPACTEDTKQNWNSEDKESWVRCDACKTWFHWRCAGEGDLDAVGKWFCKPCREADPKRIITMKPPARKSSRKRTQRDYAGLNAGNEQDPDRWHRMMQGKVIKPDPFKRMQGSDVNLEWLESDESAMREPIVIEKPDGLGMKMPDNITVREVAEIVGEETPVEVIDVASQANIPGWTLGKWADYYDTEPAKRDKIRNVISLEISGTELADKVLPPRLVREVDWVEKFWPNTKKGRGHSYPKVQLYCLMGVEKAWTDWHIDFAGSSVYYHILHGQKVFYFIRPTPANLAAYERWSGTEMQNHSWLGDLCDEVFKIELEAGNTMIIPTGWIHAVYTPVDTLVFGGNFVHSYNVATQLKVRDIEIATHVPKKFRFPYFVKLCWYAGEKYLRDLKAREEFSPRVLESIEVLADFLVSEARTMEKGSDHAKKEAKDHLPGDRVKDAPAMARELRWRVRLASGYDSDEDTRARRKAKIGAHENGLSKKRKRVEEGEEEDSSRIFLHFKPRSWDMITVDPVEKGKKTVKVAKVDISSNDGLADWSAWDVPESADGEDATVESRKDVIVKVRRTAHGLERQRVQRTLEQWTWTPAGPDVPPSTETTAPPATNGTSATPEAAKSEDIKMAGEAKGEDVKMAVEMPYLSDIQDSVGSNSLCNAIFHAAPLDGWNEEACRLMSEAHPSTSNEAARPPANDNHDWMDSSLAYAQDDVAHGGSNEAEDLRPPNRGEHQRVFYSSSSSSTRTTASRAVFST
ncbi:hypothetical protein NM688_g8215 [Phlebia brevispora]|uniref:Uncharacterized protein n=1 Tax=Phlebia brevispora TaxID=194682 RepID=A0ACC1RVT1_9APHY|nr:hypothetical protein NM688_g8215 [Phlebia brevispora]